MYMRAKPFTLRISGMRLRKLRMRKIRMLLLMWFQYNVKPDGYFHNHLDIFLHQRAKNLRKLREPVDKKK